MALCDVCGSTVTGRANRLRCSSECDRRAARRRAASSNARARTDGRYESWKRRQRKPPSKTCQYCSAPCQRKICPSVECRKAYNRDRVREQQRRYRDEYRARGESYNLRFVTPEQKAARLATLAAWAKTPAGKEQRRVSRQECFQRRRAQKAGVRSEKFHHADVYARDGWICGLCGVPVDPDRVYPDPASASLDHVVPLSMGGPHTRDNTQLAHLECNVTKGNSHDFEGGVAA